MRAPTLKEEVETFHLIMDAFNMCQINGRNDHVKKIVEKMDNWSYAHRVGNGTLSDREQRQCVIRAFWALDEVVRNHMWEPLRSATKAA